MAKEIVNWQLNYGNHCWPTVFFENHDTTRMTSKVCPDGFYRNELSKLLAVMQLTMKGCPFIYQGQEIGMCNAEFRDMSEFRDVESINYYNELIEKGESREKAYEVVLAGSRDNGRTPMCWTKGENAGFTTGTPWIKLIENHEKINVEAQDKDRFSVLNFYRSMTKLRHDNPALVYGEFELADAKWKNVLSYYRKGEEAAYYIEMNLTDKPQKKPLSTKNFEKVISNINTSKEKELMPFEANIYKVK